MYVAHAICDRHDVPVPAESDTVSRLRILKTRSLLIWRLTKKKTPQLFHDLRSTACSNCKLPHLPVCHPPPPCRVSRLQDSAANPNYERLWVRLTLPGTVRLPIRGAACVPTQRLEWILRTVIVQEKHQVPTFGSVAPLEFYIT